MKRTSTPFAHIARCFVGMAWLLLALQAPAQSPGSQAQSGTDDMAQQPSQQQAEPLGLAKAERTIQPAPAPATSQAPSQLSSTHDDVLVQGSAWERAMHAKAEPAQPKRTIPLIVVLLGLFFMLAWTALLLGAILASTAVLALVLLIGVIVFSPLLILGVIMVIGGIVATTSGGKKRKQPVTPN